MFGHLARAFDIAASVGGQAVEVVDHRQLGHRLAQGGDLRARGFVVGLAQQRCEQREVCLGVARAQFDRLAIRARGRVDIAPQGQQIGVQQPGIGIRRGLAHQLCCHLLGCRQVTALGRQPGAEDRRRREAGQLRKRRFHRLPRLVRLAEIAMRLRHLRQQFGRGPGLRQRRAVEARQHLAWLLLCQPQRGQRWRQFHRLVAQRVGAPKFGGGAVQVARRQQGAAEDVAAHR